MTEPAAAAERVLRPARRLGPPPLVPTPRGGPLPLSFAQQRLWFIEQLQPGSTAYHLPVALRLSGRLDPAALRHGLEEICRRHEALRTRFDVGPGGPVQLIDPPAALPLPCVDLTALAGARREGELRRLLPAVVFRPFDLRRGPLLRATLVALAAADHALVTTMHHIVADGWSAGVLMAELAALYGARYAGRPSPRPAGGAANGEPGGLPRLPVQYADYAVWQRAWLSGTVLEREIAHWRNALAGARVIALPADRPRHRARGGAAGTHPFTLSAAVTAELMRLSRGQNVTLFMVLLAAFQILLGRHSGEEDVTVGSPVANRGRREIEGLVGFFVNTLVLRTAIAATADGTEILRRARATALAAFAHQDLPFEKLVEELQPARGPRSAPFFQILFALQNTPLPVRRLPGLELSPLLTASRSAKFELTLSLGEGDDGGIQGEAEYASELFDRTTIARLMEHLANLLRGLAVAADRPVADLPLLGAAERHQLAAEWNDTLRALPRQALVQRQFAAQVARRPEAVAVVSAGGAALSYGELSRRVARLARRLRRLGVAPGSAVGVLLPRSPEMVTAFLAVLAAGGAYLPLDPSHPAERLCFMVRDAGAPVVIARAPHGGPLAGEPVTLLMLDDPDGAARDADGATTESETTASAAAAPPVAVSLGDAIAALARAGGGGAGLPPAAAGGEPACILYTSGSTGRPKGVAVSHRAVIRLVHEAGHARLGPEDVLMQLAPAAFDASTFEIWAPCCTAAGWSWRRRARWRWPTMATSSTAMA
jgi:non-ribosomal peptide synthetase component F